MIAQRSTRPGVGMATFLGVCLALPGMTLAKAGFPEEHPGGRFVERPAPILTVHDTIKNFPKWSRAEPCEIPPVWRKKFPGPDRFVAVLNGAAYCDQETGLVWETSPASGSFDWTGAINHCATREVGARKGWSLPKREQLASLVDTNSGLCTGGGLCVPDGHPFQNVQSASYWSATTTSGTPTFAWLVNFFFGSVLVSHLDGNGLAWCTRADQSYGWQNLAAMK
ncbi:MAG TPA: DUF1566 domain-containing protein [Nitrospirales bacterium]|nr:hypothetical protein [Nitrospiraceae bacterium]HNP27981.1 DUF1566 domain-containing protein [Nitrospirales bacterium]